MKDLILIGAGGCGREVLQWVNDINAAEKRWNIKGFLNDYPEFDEELREKKCQIPVIGKINDYVIEPNDEFACCIGDAVGRKKIFESYKAKGATFATIIHPSAVIAQSCDLGEGVIIYPLSLISANAIIGDGCMINMHTSIAHDVRIGKFSTISAHCDITGRCILGENVFMGTSSHIVPRTKIGDNVYICAGATVMTRVLSNRKVMGNPAKVVNF